MWLISLAKSDILGVNDSSNNGQPSARTCVGTGMGQERRNIRAEAEVWAMIEARAASRGTSLSDYLIAAGLARAVFDFEQDDPEGAAAWRAAYDVGDDLVRRMNYRANA